MATILMTTDGEQTVLLISQQELAEVVARMFKRETDVEEQFLFALDIARVVAEHCKGRVLNERVGPGLNVHSIYVPDEIVLGGGDKFWEEENDLDPLIESAEVKQVREINFLAECEREADAFLEKYDGPPS
jgi:hypothetical protein